MTVCSQRRLRLSGICLQMVCSGFGDYSDKILCILCYLRKANQCDIYCGEGEKDTSNFKSIRQLLICEITFCLLKVLYKNYLLVLLKEFQPHLQYINFADIKEPFVFCCDKN